MTATQDDARKRIDEAREKIDALAATGVEVQIAANGRTLWVNIDGCCKLRVILNAAATIMIEDSRGPRARGKVFET